MDLDVRKGDMENIAKQKETLVVYQNEVAKCAERWGKWNLLSGIDDPYIKGQMALFLENQRLINECSANGGDDGTFRRLAIPIVRRMYAPNLFLGWELCHISGFLGPVGISYMRLPGEEWHYQEIAAKTKRCKTSCKIDHPEIREGHSLDKEAEATIVMTLNLADEINREIITDLKNNAGMAVSFGWNGAVNIYAVICNLRAQMQEQWGVKHNWLVTSPEIAKVLKDYLSFKERQLKPDDWTYCKVWRTGEFDNDDLKLIEDKEFPTNEILLGYKGEDPYVAGYSYHPYVPLTKTPVILDPENFTPRYGVLTRYAKCLRGPAFPGSHVGGSKCYVKLTVNDFPEKAQ